MESPDFANSPTAKLVRQALWRAEGRLRQTKKRAAVARSSVPIGGQIDPPDKLVNAHLLVEMTIDLAGVMDDATPEEQRVWSLMCNHMNNARIARELGWDHRRVSDTRAGIMKKIEHVLRE